MLILTSSVKLWFEIINTYIHLIFYWLIRTGLFRVNVNVTVIIIIIKPTVRHRKLNTQKIFN